MITGRQRNGCQSPELWAISVDAYETHACAGGARDHAISRRIS